MQSLDVISVNLWQILISLANLLILFFVLKKFLFKPVKRVMAEREGELAARYTAAEEAETAAEQSRLAWDTKMQSAEAEANAILKRATDNAEARGEAIISEAKQRASGIIAEAENEAILTRRAALDGIKREIVEVSGALTEKMLDREISTEDHRALIDSFIEGIGDGNE